MCVVWHGGFLTSNQHSCPCESWRPCVCKLVIEWLATKEKLYKSQPKTNQQSKAAHWLEFGMGNWNFTKIYQNKTKRWMNMVHSWKSLAILGPDPFSCWKVYAVWETFNLLISNPKGETRENHPNSGTRQTKIIIRTDIQRGVNDSKVEQMYFTVSSVVGNPRIHEACHQSVKPMVCGISWLIGENPLKTLCFLSSWLNTQNIMKWVHDVNVCFLHFIYLCFFPPPCFIYVSLLSPFLIFECWWMQNVFVCATATWWQPGSPPGKPSWNRPTSMDLPSIDDNASMASTSIGTCWAEVTR